MRSNVVNSPSVLKKRGAKVDQAPRIWHVGGKFFPLLFSRFFARPFLKSATCSETGEWRTQSCGCRPVLYHYYPLRGWEINLSLFSIERRVPVCVVCVTVERNVQLHRARGDSSRVRRRALELSRERKTWTRGRGEEESRGQHQQFHTSHIGTHSRCFLCRRSGLKWTEMYIL